MVIVKQLLAALPVTIVAEWVKGHYTGEYREYKHDLNDKVDKLAGTFNKNPPTILKQRKLPSTLPGYSIRLLHEGSHITNKLYSTMSIALHRRRFISYLKEKHGWTDNIFDRINWEAHELAFKHLNRSGRIAVAKLIHKLINMNRQNFKFYGKSALCPSCQIVEESWTHVFTCGSQGPLKSRITSLAELQKDLATINTPGEVITAITHGMEMWEKSQEHPQLQVHALTVGSLKSSHVLLTAAFTEQFHSIGWDQLLMGRQSKYWGVAVASFGTEPNNVSIQTRWTTQAIGFLWKYMRTAWTYRNTVVHGSTDQEMAVIIKKASTDKVKEYYNIYSTTPHFILPCHKYLFMSRSLDQCLNLDIDSIN